MIGRRADLFQPKAASPGRARASLVLNESHSKAIQPTLRLERLRADEIYQGHPGRALALVGPTRHPAMSTIASLASSQVGDAVIFAFLLWAGQKPEGRLSR